MPNKQNKKQPQRKKKQPSKQVALIKQPTKPRVSPHEINLVCGLTDPFCKHAFGAKYPDNSNTRTLAYTRHGRQTIMTDFQGTGAFIFLPNYFNSPIVTPTSVTLAGDITWTTSFTPDTPFLAVTRYRIVSAGYRIRNIAAPLYSSGMVHVRALTPQTGASFQPMSGTSYAVSDYMDVPLQECKNLNVVVPHTSQPTINFYNPSSVPASSSMTGWQSPGFAATSCLIMGGPVDSAVLDVEYFVHYELAFDEGDQMGMIATPPPAFAPVRNAAAAKVTSSIDTFFNMGAAAIGNYLEKKAIAALGGLIGGPAGAFSAHALAITVD